MAIRPDTGEYIYTVKYRLFNYSNLYRTQIGWLKLVAGI
jgi:hypothetical protein